MGSGFSLSENIFLSVCVVYVVMKYHGGKTRQGKRISSVICSVLKKNLFLTTYTEPFCGMCGVFTHVAGDTSLEMYVALDSNTSVIMMWIALSTGWTPNIREFNEESFRKLKANGESSAEKGFFGHALTFSGLYFKNFRPELMSRLEGSVRSVSKRSDDMTDVVFLSGDYRDVKTENSLIFCDPPYQKQNFYYDECDCRKKFDSNAFWAWCLKMAENNVVVISEDTSFFEEKVQDALLSAYTTHLVDLHPISIKHCKSTCVSKEQLYIMTKLDVEIPKNY